MIEKINYLNYLIMLKNILNLDGVQKLTNKEQKIISGGLRDDQCVVTVFTQEQCAEWMGKWTAPNKCTIVKPVTGPDDYFEFILC
ncbi:hypothetical protein [Flavobacterium terrae]|nr:hypothetical protein [Flavobacterium terrae]